MARLTAQARKNVPSSNTGLPSKRTSKGGAVKGSYPMPDKTHARVAKSYAARYASPSQRAEIDAKANAILDRKKSIVKKANKVKGQAKRGAAMLKKTANVTARSVK